MNFDIRTTILTIPAILIGFTVHEYAHAYTADKLGDKTPKFQGRLTLNPFAHIDWVGFLMILLFRFGWAKPVEINPSAFKHYYKDDFKVSFAGPLSNLITAFIFAILTEALVKFNLIGGTVSTVSVILQNIFVYTIYINCMLFVFNLIPLPGLDGFHMLRDLFPKQFYKISGFMYAYQIIILIIFIISPLSHYLVGIPSGFLFELFLRIGELIF